MHTLGLYQPYAGLMLHGKVETRWVREGKKPPFPLDDYALYSTQIEYGRYQTWKVAGNEQFARLCEIRARGGKEFDLRGCIYATGILYALEPMTPEIRKNAFVDPEPNVIFDKSTGFYTAVSLDKEGKSVVRVLWALYFKKVRAIEPIPFKGKQGVGFLPADIEAKIKFV